MNNAGTVATATRTPEFADRLVAINRVSKTVKGGKRFGFAALVVVGDQKGRVGFGKGKAKEVPEAIRKATEQAKRSMVRVPLREGRTLHHDIEGRHGAGRVVMRTAVAGHRHHRGRSDAGRVRDAGPPGRGVQVAGLDQPLQHDPRDHRRPDQGIVAPVRGAASRQEGGGHPAASRETAGRSPKPWRPDPMAKTIVVKQIASPARRPDVQRQTLIGLGLNKMHKTRELEDTPSVRGMVRAIPHLVTSSRSGAE